MGENTEREGGMKGRKREGEGREKEEIKKDVGESEGMGGWKRGEKVKQEKRKRGKKKRGGGGREGGPGGGRADQTPTLSQTPPREGKAAP